MTDDQDYQRHSLSTRLSYNYNGSYIFSKIALFHNVSYMLIYPHDGGVITTRTQVRPKVEHCNNTTVLVILGLFRSPKYPWLCSIWARERAHNKPPPLHICFSSTGTSLSVGLHIIALRNYHLAPHSVYALAINHVVIPNMTINLQGLLEDATDVFLSRDKRKGSRKGSTRSLRRMDSSRVCCTKKYVNVEVAPS